MTMETDEQPRLNTGIMAGKMVCPALTFLGVLGQTLSLYRQQGGAFTRVLLLPVIKMSLGLYGAMVLSLLFVQWMTQPAQTSFTSDHLVLVLAAVLGICGVGLFFFFQGAWQYLVYWASLCCNVQEVLLSRVPDFKAAYAAVAGSKKAIYVQWLTLLCILPVVPLVPTLGLPAMSMLLPHAPAYTFPVLMVLGLLLGGLVGVVWLVVQVLLSYGFQVVVFEETPQSLWPTLWRSVVITRQRPWLTLGLQVVLLILTNYVFTVPATLLLRFTRVLAPLDDLHAWLSGVMLGNLADALHQAELWSSGAGQVMTLLQENKLPVAQGITDAVVSANLSMLLLPLGTIAFTLVYLGLSQQDQKLPALESSTMTASKEPQAD